MQLLSLIAFLALEHFRPMAGRAQVFRLFTRYALYLERHFNAGEKRHGVLAWALAVLPAVLLAAAVAWLLGRISPVLGWGWNVLVLYVMVDFKSIALRLGSIAAALREGELAAARQAVGEWRGRSAGELGSGELARVTIEQALLCGHRQFIGLLLWFLLFGVAGLLIYRLSWLLAQKWGRLDEAEYGRFGDFAGRAFEVIDWVPVRLTALSFAIVGDFEDAVYCWRTQAAGWDTPADGILLASGAGALGVRLGDPLVAHGETEFRPGLGTGEEADADFLDSALGLIWRSVAFWLVVMLLVGLGSLAA